MSEMPEIYFNIREDARDYISHYLKADAYDNSTGENSSKYLTSQFNPMIGVNMPPVIVKFNVKFYCYPLTAKMDITATIYDAGEIKKIKLIIARLQSIILPYLLWLTIKSILTFTISDGLGGIFGYIDEFILGFFFASSLITFGETVWDILLEFLSIPPQRTSDIQGVIL